MKKKKLNEKEESFPFAGKITVSENGYGFVNFNGTTIFIPAKLLAEKSIQDKATVKGEFVSAFDKTKNQDGYKAVSIDII